jgi:hypothetical protein
MWANVSMDGWIWIWILWNMEGKLNRWIVDVVERRGGNYYCLHMKIKHGKDYKVHKNR